MIQVSESCYRDHKAKYDPESSDVGVYKASVQNPISEAEPIKYIYLTPNDSLMASDDRRSQYFRSDVLLVAGDDMKRLF